MTMEKWKKMSYMVAVYLFFIELRPLEPYLTAYLIGPNGNLSLYEVANTMSLIKSYVALFGSLVMLITADYLLYKPNIIFLTVWSLTSYIMMIGSPSLMRIRVATVGLGVMYSANMVAFSYLYAQIEDIHQFQMATGIVAAAAQLGKVTGDFLAEVIVNTTGGVYTALPYCNVFSMFLAIIWACLFPSIVRKYCFASEIESNEKSQLLKNNDEETTTELCEKIPDKVILDEKQNIVMYMSKEIWTNFKSSYSNPIVLKISLWYVLGLGASISVLANINVLYSYVIEIPGNHDKLSNGFSEALVTLFGAIGAYMIGKVQLDWTYYGDIFTAFCSVAMGIFVMSLYFFNHLYLIYTSYVLFGLVSQAHLVIVVFKISSFIMKKFAAQLKFSNLLTSLCLPLYKILWIMPVVQSSITYILSQIIGNRSEIAKQLERKCYSLVLVFNYLGASLVSTIMMTYFTQHSFLTISIPGRFLFIGVLFILLGILFLFISVYKATKKK